MAKDYTINKDALPKHIAIIMDGNGRWAKKQGLLRVAGHEKGTKAVREAVEGCAELGVKNLTLYAFSTENWNRPQEEVEGLMNLLVLSLANEIDEMNQNGVRLQTIGNIEGMPQDCQLSLKDAINKTKENKEITLVLALNYSSKWEIKEMVKTLSNKINNKEIREDEVTDDLISAHLTTSGIPDPELLIRTSGERRVSNFLLWQIAYSEFVFLDIFWPDFGRKHFVGAIYDFQNRERRFGLVSEQINTLE